MSSITGINPSAKPSGTGCVECLKQGKGALWLHLRRCAECGHIGCCDGSPSKHARAHFEATGHNVIQSFEPGEDWFFNYVTGREVRTHLVLAAPTSHPANQVIPFYVGLDK